VREERREEERREEERRENFALSISFLSLVISLSF